VIDLHAPGCDRVLVVGHRGAEALAPENTWAGLRKGYDAGADLLELDVQLTCDGEAIVFHDFTLQPKLGDLRWVRDLAWDELRGVDVGRWFGPAFSGERIPRFAEVLDWARGRVALWVDLKHGFDHTNDGRLEATVLDLIEAAHMKDQALISSWDQVALDRIRARTPEIPLAVNLPQRVADPVGQVAPTGVRWVTLFWPQADRSAVDQLQEGGFVVNLANLFTGEYSEAQRLGVDAVTAGDPAAARTALAKQGDGR
jgi:glycerophosphoryl diester phosphodiesterase